MKHFLLFLVLFFSIITAYAQQITVYSIATQEATADVAIYNSNSSISTITNSKGQADISAFSQGDSIYFQHPTFLKHAMLPKDITGGKVFLIERVIMLNEFVVSVSKTRESTSSIPNQVEVVTATEITFNNSQTSADVLENTGKIFVQRSQMGGGSPILRGFEANKVLIVVDGVRLNNAIYRGGHLQNVITLDNAVVERTEVVFGPGSLIYGSDALGGVMHFYTKDPKLAEEGEKSNIFGSAYGRFASANLEKRVHFDVNFGFKRLASFTGVTFTDFGDLRMGSRANSFYEDFGKRTQFVETIDNEDLIRENDNVLVQKFTGYQQVDLIQKFLMPIGEKLDLTLNYQFSTTNNVPRYDRLAEYRGVETTDTIGIQVLPDTTLYIDSTFEIPRLRFAQWDYGPQKRHFLSAKLDLKDGSRAYSSGQVIVGYQHLEEERINRQFGNTLRRNQVEKVDVLTVNADFYKKATPTSTVQYGFESTYNRVNSTATNTDIVTGEVSPTGTRYPEGGTNMQTHAAYLKLRFDISERVFISPGIRYSYISLHTEFEEVDIVELDLDEITLNTSAFSGAFGLTYNAGKNWQVNLMASSGYRAPNLDDLGKVFNPAPGIVVVPNKDLKPEYAYNLEFSIKKTFRERIQAEMVLFNTIVSNAIVRQPFAINNLDELTFDGELMEVNANVNIGRAVIRGFNFAIQAELTQTLSLSSSIAYTYGQDVTNDVPLAHIPPIYGQSSLVYRKSRFRGELMMRYNGWKRLDDYSPSSVDNLDEATEFGTPAWYTVNLRLAYQFSEHFRLQMALDNVLDQNYRVFASGVSAPGINFVLMAKVNF